MAIQVALNHKTQYRYDRLVALGPQVVRLRPAPHCRTPILSYSLKIQPKKHFLNWQQDPQANYLARLVFPDPTTEFFVEVDLVAEMAIFNPFDFFLEPYAEKYPFTYDDGSARELRAFLETESLTPALETWISTVSREPVRTIDFLISLNQRLRNDIGYVIRMETGVQTCEQTLSLRTGSCRDSAWLLVQILRHLGLAARFVSGYLIQLAADVKPLEGPAGPTSDFTDLHAWTEVFLPGAGWVGLDPTSGLLAGEGHIPLACTPDASSAAPVSGLLSPCNTTFHHEMSVRRIYESPRVTKPYTEEQWNEVLALGHKVDADLKAGDVRLTMGGEPTFVSLDNASTPEWNTPRPWAPEKRKLFRWSFSPAASRPIRARRAAAFRTRQVVSRRAAATLGAELLLAQRWRPDLGRSVPVRRRSSEVQIHGERCPALPPSIDAEAASGSIVHHVGLRGHVLLPLARAPAAGECGPAGFQGRGSDRARSSGADF